jgi:hypothetical protein
LNSIASLSLSFGRLPAGPKPSWLLRAALPSSSATVRFGLLHLDDQMAQHGIVELEAGSISTSVSLSHSMFMQT